MDVRSTPWRSTHSQRLKPGGPGAVARGLLQGRAQLLVAILLPVPENYGRRLFAFTLLFHVNAKLIVLLKEYVPSHESIAKSGSYFLATLTARIGTRTVVALLRANKQQSVANVGLQRSALGTKDRSGQTPLLHSLQFWTVWRAIPEGLGVGVETVHRVAQPRSKNLCGGRRNGSPEVLYV